MSIIQTVKRLIGSGEESQESQLYSCRNCSNLFTKNDTSGDAEGVTCPNCGSDDVDLAVP